MAFSLGIAPDEAREQFNRSDNLIFTGGTAWVPVEITLRNEGFMRAWKTGAKEWREYSAEEKAGFYPVHTGWDVFKPVGFPGAPSITYPAKEQVAEAFVQAEKTFIRQEITDEVAALQEKISESQNVRWTNKLGVLYARYGLDEDALAQFEKVLRQRGNYYPAMINIGNIHYLRDEIEQALSYYQQAAEMAPDNPTVLLNLARTNHKLEKLQEVSPSLADRFAYPNFAKLFKILDKTGKIRHFQKVKLLQYNKMQILVVCVVTNTYNL